VVFFQAKFYGIDESGTEVLFELLNYNLEKLDDILLEEFWDDPYAVFNQACC